MKNTERLLLEIGLRPSRRGFAQSAMLLCILRDRPEIRSSSAAYALAAERLIATPGQLEHNLRMTIREAWERGDRALLRRLLPWCGDACPPHRRRRISCLAWPHGYALASRRTSCRAAAETVKRRRATAHGQRNDGRQTAAAVQPQRTVGRNAGTAAAARRREAQISGSCRIGGSRGTQARGADNRRLRNRQRPPGSRKPLRIGKPFRDSRDGIVHECCGKQQASTVERAIRTTPAMTQSVQGGRYGRPARFSCTHSRQQRPGTRAAVSQIKNGANRGAARPLASIHSSPR